MITNILEKLTNDISCCKRCLGRANGRRSQEDMQGDKNPNWKGGIETENHKVRTSLEYEDWRKQIFTELDKCKKIIVP